MKKSRKPTDRSRIPYTRVWTEQGVREGLLCKGEEIVIPEGWHKDHDVELRDWGGPRDTARTRGRTAPRGSGD